MYRAKYKCVRSCYFNKRLYKRGWVGEGDFDGCSHFVRLSELNKPKPKPPPPPPPPPTPEEIEAMEKKAKKKRVANAMKRHKEKMATSEALEAEEVTSIEL